MEITDYGFGDSGRASGGGGVRRALVVAALAGWCLQGGVIGAQSTNTLQVTNMTTNSKSQTAKADPRSTNTIFKGGIVRGPRDKKVMALEFTGGSFAEGGTIILDTLAKHGIKGSFFFTGDFLREPEFKGLIERIRDEGHYLGAHSDKHPLYATWENPPKLQISKEEFNRDLDGNMAELARFGIGLEDAKFFVPPYEHYTQEISDWTAERGMILMNYTTGTRSNADYMQDDDPKFVSSEDMVKSIFDYEEKDPDGMNGFILLTHVGAGPGRTRDKLFNHLDEIITELKRRGYSFKRVDELLSE